MLKVNLQFSTDLYYYDGRMTESMEVLAKTTKSFTFFKNIKSERFNWETTHMGHSSLKLKLRDKDVGISHRPNPWIHQNGDP